MSRVIRNYQPKINKFRKSNSDIILRRNFAQQSEAYNRQIPLQPYPGAILPDFGERVSFPIPDQVGQYCTREEFIEKPKYMAQWVHWPERVQDILNGRYDQLKPVHFEGIFTLVCNLTCPHCTRRVARSRWVEQNSWGNNAEINAQNTLPPDQMMRVIEQLSTMKVDDQMGIVWGGGDPTANPYTYNGMMYAKSLGISSSFLTNGVFLNVQQVLDAEPTLIRISLNCGSEETYRKFHGYPRGWNYFEKAITNLRELVKEKLVRGSKSLVGISLIMDERNIDDIVNAVKVIKSIVEEVGPGVDYVIVRPVFHYGHFETKWTKIEQDTKAKAKKLIAPGGPVWSTLSSVNVPLVPIKDSFESPPSEEFYKDTRCLAYGMCGEVRYNGDVQICSDSYGNPEYTIGNLLTHSLDEIWSSNKRFSVLNNINERNCYKTYCPYNSRGHHYNRIFHQIDELRLTGKIDTVQRWVEDLRAVTYPLGHSFFI